MIDEAIDVPCSLAQVLDAVLLMPAANILERVTRADSLYSLEPIRIRLYDVDGLELEFVVEVMARRVDDVVVRIDHQYRPALSIGTAFGISMIHPSRTLIGSMLLSVSHP